MGAFAYSVRYFWVSAPTISNPINSNKNVLLKFCSTGFLADWRTKVCFSAFRIQIPYSAVERFRESQENCCVILFVYKLNIKNYEVVKFTM